MATFVLVHGAWHGGGCWDQVADGLRASGYRATAPTLTGLGDRAGEAHSGIGLDAHVDEVARLIAQLREVVVVGHSYGGMVAVGAVAAAPSPVVGISLVDGFVPEAGESVMDLLPARTAAYFSAAAAERGDGWRIPPTPLTQLGVTDQAVVDRWASRLVAQPLRTYTDPSRASASGLSVPGHYLGCSGWRSSFLDAQACARQIGWDVDVVDADHEIPLTDPGAVVERLVRWARTVGVAGSSP